MRSYGIWLDPIGDAALTDAPGFLTNGRDELSFDTHEQAERELAAVDDEIRGAKLSVRERADLPLDFPADDSGSQPHVVEPATDPYDALCDELAKLFAAPWPCVPAYA